MIARVVFVIWRGKLIVACYKLLHLRTTSSKLMAASRKRTVLRTVTSKPDPLAGIVRRSPFGDGVTYRVPFKRECVRCVRLAEPCHVSIDVTSRRDTGKCVQCRSAGLPCDDATKVYVKSLRAERRANRDLTFSELDAIASSRYPV